MEIAKKLIDDLENKFSLDAKSSFDYAKTCSLYLRNPDKAAEGRRIIINVLDNWDKIDKSTKEIWTDLIESAGFYPYLEKEKENIILSSIPAKVRKEFHKSFNIEEYFHEEQRYLNLILNSDRSLIVSAPTSFGKSILIQEIVASRKYKNIVIIQPTLALIDETRKKLKKYAEDYRIIVRTSQRPSTNKRNIFLLTAERVMEYSDLPEIDFFIIDEFYKLSSKRDEERSDVLNNAFYLLANKFKSRFYLLGPNVDGISSGFAEKYNAEFVNTYYTLVDNRVIDKSSPEFGDRLEKKENKLNALFDLLFELRNEQTIIYCSSPQRVRAYSMKFCKYLDDLGIPSKTEKLPLIEWIEENIGEKWGVIKCLNHGLGTHDGTLPKHITSSIIQYFNEKKLNYLFCTTTIIEGVNTSAKNVVFFDKTKGLRKPLDSFDYDNLKGRSGRMMVHYVGRIFNFNKPPERKSVIIDIPFFEQKNISDEILIHIAEKDVKNKSSKQYVILRKIPEEERKIFKKNGVLVEDQKAILETLKQEIDEKYPLIYWDGLPQYNQLTYVLSLAWNNLIKKGETIGRMTPKKLVKVTFDYAKYGSITHLINSNFDYFKTLSNFKDKTDEEVFDAAVTDALQILRHWFHYKVPKWLNVMNSLQEFVCEKKGLKPGNYNYYSTQIENDFVRNNLSILVEYRIPRSAVAKLERHLSYSLSEEEVLYQIKSRKLYNIRELLEYERQKIIENI